MEQSMLADLVIVGGGLAGYSAALEAARADCDVLLLEKLTSTGGSSAMSGGFFAFAGTEIQRASGIVDSTELLFSDLREVGQLENDESLVRAYVGEQLATFEWLKSAGVVFSPDIEASSGQSVPRAHSVDSADMMRTLAARARETGKIRVMTTMRARRLMCNAQTGVVEGVSAEGEDGPVHIMSRRGVILATGGFTRNAELIHRLAPNCDKAMVTGGEGNVGDGLLMAWKLGADVRDTAHIKATYGKHPGENTEIHACVAYYRGAIVVNDAGKRYVDESISYKLLGDACLRQPYAVTYQIFDQDIFETGDNRNRLIDFERRLENGLLIQADTLAQLARKIEIPVDELERTVAQYNRYVDAGCDEAFGRKHLVHNFGDLRRIERAPFYTYPSTAIIFSTYCGPRVDDQMRVLDVFGERIEGLMAAGEVIGGFHGAAYMTGSGLGKAAAFGRIAARTALARR